MPTTLVLMAPGLLARSDETLAAMRSLGRLATFARDVTRSRDVASALFASLGMRADTPVAPAALLGAGGDPDDDYVLCAEPVHLDAGAGHAIDVTVVSDLAPTDVETVIRMLDRHFVADGLRFEAGRGTTWFARRAQASDVMMTAPSAAHGATLAESLPRGGDSARWRRWQDEIAMLLHDHPVNRMRETADMPTVNAIWFFGGGRLRDVIDVPQVVVADATGFLADVARGLAGLRASATTGGGGSMNARADSTSRDARFVVDVAQTGAEEAALLRALAQLEAGEVEAVHVIAGGRRGAITWRAAVPGPWRRIVARARPRAFQLPAARD